MTQHLCVGEIEFRWLCKRRGIKGIRALLVIGESLVSSWTGYGALDLNNGVPDEDGVLLESILTYRSLQALVR